MMNWKDEQDCYAVDCAQAEVDLDLLEHEWKIAKREWQAAQRRERRRKAGTAAPLDPSLSSLVVTCRP